MNLHLTERLKTVRLERYDTESPVIIFPEHVVMIGGLVMQAPGHGLHTTLGGPRPVVGGCMAILVGNLHLPLVGSIEDVTPELGPDFVQIVLHGPTVNRRHVVAIEQGRDEQGRLVVGQCVVHFDSAPPIVLLGHVGSLAEAIERGAPQPPRPQLVVS